MLKRSDPEYRKMIKRPASAWVVVAIDPLSTRLTWLLRRTPVTPNQLTLFSLVVAGAATVAFASGNFVVGAVLSQVRFLLDCADGQLARHRGTSSRFGAFFDVFADVTSILSMCVGFAIGLDSTAVQVAVLVFVVIYAVLAWLRSVASTILTGESGPSGSGAIKPFPTSVEAETLVLFAAPLLPWDGARLACVAAGSVVVLAAAALDFRDMTRVLRSEAAPESSDL